MNDWTLPNLKRLNVASTGLDNSAFRDLVQSENFQQLKTLNISGNKMSQKAIVEAFEMGRFDGLRVLELSGMGITQTLANVFVRSHRI